MSYELMGVFFFFFFACFFLYGWILLLDYRLHTTKNGYDTILFVFAKTD